MVSKQLRCSGIMEAVRVIAAGYPDRVPHSEILGRFAALIQLDQRPSADKAGEKAAASQVVLHSIAWMLHAGGSAWVGTKTSNSLFPGRCSHC